MSGEMLYRMLMLHEKNNTILMEYNQSEMKACMTVGYTLIIILIVHVLTWWTRVWEILYAGPSD